MKLKTGEKDATVWILNVQPVVPIKLTEDWNVITRTIIPIINTSLQAYYNAVTPDFGPDWQLRFQVQFLQPNIQKKPAF